MPPIAKLGRIVKFKAVANLEVQATRQSQRVSALARNSSSTAQSAADAVADASAVNQRNSAAPAKNEVQALEQQTRSAESSATNSAAQRVNFGALLRKLKGPPPEGMVDPHAHHIVFKEGNGAAQKALVQEGQAILKSYGIDPIVGPENLVWAPNRIAGQHGPEALQNVVDQLKAVRDFGGTREDIIAKLNELGQLAARRR